MSDDLQTKVSADLGTTLQQLDSLKRKIKEIDQASVSASRAAKDHQASLGGAAKALGKGGGLAGGMLGKVGEVSGMSGPLAPLAAGAVILGSAFKVLGDLVTRQTDSMKAGLQLQQTLANAERSARASANSSALSTVKSQMGARRRLLFRGGQGAVQLSQWYAERGGVSSADAMSGVAAGYDVSQNPAEQGAITEAAYMVASSGDMGMAEAVQAIGKNPGARMAAQSGDALGAASLVLGGNNPMQRQRARDRILAAQSGNAFSPLDDIQSAGNAIDAIHGNDYNGAAVAVREQLAGARNPESAATNRLLQVQQEALYLQRMQVDKLSSMARWFEVVTGNRAELNYESAMEGYDTAIQSYKGGN